MSTKVNDQVNSALRAFDFVYEESSHSRIQSFEAYKNPMLTYYTELAVKMEHFTKLNFFPRDWDVYTFIHYTFQE